MGQKTQKQLLDPRPVPGQSRQNVYVYYAAPIGAFFCPEIRAFTGFRGEISSTGSKVLSDRKVLFKHKNDR